jgi:O-antigen/teichoic acid export membrane protein
MTEAKIAQNATFLTVALALQKALSFFYFILVARFIGVENTGKYSFSLSFVTIFAIFLDFGLTQILIRETARDPKNATKYLSNIIGLKLIGSLIIYFLAIVIINLMGYPEITRQMVYVAGVVMLIDSFALSFYGVLRGLHNLRFESFGVVLNQIIVLFVGLLVLKFNLGLVALVAVYLIGSLFNFFYALSRLIFSFKIIPKISLNRAVIKQILILALPFAMAGIFARIFGSIDMVMLSKLADDRAVGLYSVAYKIIFALQFIPLAFSASLYPAFSGYFVRSPQLLAKTFVRSMNYLMILALPLSVGIITIANKVIGPVFGSSYSESILTLQILSSALFLIFICFPVGAMLNAGNQQSRNTVNLGLVTGVNITLNLIFIPLFSQAGAALASLLSYVLLFILGLAVVEKIAVYDKKYLLLSFLKVLTSSVIMGAVVLALKDYLSFILVIPLGALIYFMTLFIVGGFGKEDILQIRRLAVSR